MEEATKANYQKLGGNNMKTRRCLKFAEYALIKRFWGNPANFKPREKKEITGYGVVWI